MTPDVLASTVSHKQESLVRTLEVFSRLGLHEIDLNLHHLLEEGVDVETTAAALADGGHRAWVVSGGWCDFFHAAPAIEDTWRSIDRQVRIAQRLGAGTLRLFFGRLTREAFGPSALETAAGNLSALSARYPEMLFVFENHDGASMVPGICRAILERADRLNIRMNFDPINFERAGVRSQDALDELRPLIGHVHIKGLDRNGFCEFGTGDVDLTPIVRSLVASGYAGAFTVEYEGQFDRTIRLYESMMRARALLKELRGTGGS